MNTLNLEIDVLTPAIGAEISGVDLSKALDDRTIEAIYQALLDHLVIFFRDQKISPQAHIAFAEAFGELDVPHPIYPHVAGFERVVLLENDAERPPDTNDWHTDMTFHQEPPFASVLYSREVPETGGDTLWASMYAAYDALPSEMKAHLANLSAMHDMGSFRNQYLAEGGIDALNEAMSNVGSAVHPVVGHHPVTDKPFLHVNASFTAHVVDMSTRDSDRLLHYLYNHIDRPEFQVRFRWQADCVAMWDNRVTQHYAVADYMSRYRRMHRVTVVNDRRAAATTSKPAQATGT